MRSATWLAASGYLILLVASQVVRSGRDRSEVLHRNEIAVTVGAVDHEGISSTPVRIVLYDSAPAAPVPVPLLLIHGSPGDKGEVTRLAGLLAGERRTLAPDLPGFGGSTRSIPDYSIRAHARYLLQMLDSLGIGTVHLLGFSMGGGVALELTAMAPARVASVTMLSAIGVQEFELLGDYHLNRGVHALQLAGLWLLHNGVPHFGLLDGGMLTVEYARNFFDSDQRPLRDILSRLEQPMLIVQGKSDPLVPPAIAPEHHRIVPQSEMLLVDGNHFMAFQRAPSLAGPIAQFLDRVESGTAPSRARASPERRIRAAEPLDPATVPRTSGIGFVVLVLLIALATLVSEDLTCIATGLLVSRGTIGFIPGTAACLVGIVLGDMLLFLAGRYLGRPALARRPLRWLVSDRNLARTSAWFARRGPALVLTSRFIPGTRLPTYLAAGVLHTPPLPFFSYFLLAASVWTPLLVGSAALYGDMLLSAFDAYQRWSIPVLAAAALLFLAVVKLLIPALSWRGRRLLLGRWRRLTRWEFWPPWAFYLPVVCYVLWLGIRYRCLTLFSAANPAIPAGGFVGESKFDILRGLARSADRLPATILLQPDRPEHDRLATVAAFMRQHQLQWPLVLKPDAGERGRGVSLVRSDGEVRKYLEHAPGPVLLQEYLPGCEFGIFYYRIPGEDRGRIFSITEKRMPVVIGDGHSNLETLILRDPRAVCIAPLLMEQHAPNLWSVPRDGESVPLVEVGTHARGAVFLDGTALRTPALEDAVDRVSRDFEGFWFGRYDVRAASSDALQRGCFAIVELNGVTSEATSIYDPRNRLLDAYRTLRAQWRLGFEIGARNRARGARPATLRELGAALRRHYAARPIS